MAARMTPTAMESNVRASLYIHKNQTLNNEILYIAFINHGLR